MAAQGLCFVPLFKGPALWFPAGHPRAVPLTGWMPISRSLPTPDLGDLSSRPRRWAGSSVGRLGPSSPLYRCDDPDARRLHTDPLTQSMTLGCWNSPSRRNVSLYPPSFCWALGPLIPAGFLGSRPPVLQLVEAPPPSPCWSPFYWTSPVVLVWLLLQCRRFCRLRRSLREGSPMEHRTGRFRGQVARSRFLILFALLFAVLSASYLRPALSRAGALEHPRSSPLPPLLSISPTLRTDPAFTYRHLYLSDRDAWKITYKRRGPSSPARCERSGRGGESQSGTGRITAGPIPPFRLSYHQLTLPSWQNPPPSRR